MHYLTKIEVEKQEAFSRQISDPYSWHQALWKSFPGQDGKKRSFLFRVDEKETDFIIHILSELPVSAQNWGIWQTKEVGAQFLNHGQYRFQLRANPTMRLGSGKDRGKRVGIYKDEDLKNWFLRKSQQSGFSSEDFIISNKQSDYFNKKGRSNKLNRIDFQGILEVTDEERFVTAFNTGIGSAKSLGFGMLVLQPII